MQEATAKGGSKMLPTDRKRAHRESNHIDPSNHHSNGTAREWANIVIGASNIFGGDQLRFKISAP